MTNYKVIKKAYCPKCQRICNIIGSETVENPEWVMMHEVKMIEDELYYMICPGCGVGFYVSTIQPVPVWDEFL